MEKNLPAKKPTRMAMIRAIHHACDADLRRPSIAERRAARRAAKLAAK